MKSIRFRVDHSDTGHIDFTVFMGNKDCTRANCGSLCMEPLEYSIFTQLLHAGAMALPELAEVITDTPEL